MPPFPERESSLLAKLKKKKGEKVVKEDKEADAPQPTAQQTTIVPPASNVSFMVFFE